MSRRDVKYNGNVEKGLEIHGECRQLTGNTPRMLRRDGKYTENVEKGRKYTENVEKGREIHREC